MFFIFFLISFFFKCNIGLHLLLGSIFLLCNIRSEIFNHALKPALAALPRLNLPYFQSHVLLVASRLCLRVPHVLGLDLPNVAEQEQSCESDRNHFAQLVLVRLALPDLAYGGHLSKPH